MWKGFTCGLLLAALCLSPTAFAWESDMHYGFTKWIALQAGYKPEAAEILGDRAESIDGHILDAVHLMWRYACRDRDRRASEEIRDYHFPTFQAVGQSPEKRKVEPDSEAALRQAEVIVKLPQSDRNEALRKLGDALHVAQDSWSHFGIPDIPQVLGIYKCDPDLGWGHPKLRGGWAEHTADLTYRSRVEAYEAAKRTYTILRDFLQVNDVFRASKGKEWREIEEDVSYFVQARTKTEKKQWFGKRGISDVSFLYRINIEDGPESFRTLRGVTRKVRDRAIQGMARIDIPKDTREFFDQFYKQWATTSASEFESWVSKLTDPDAVASSLRIAAQSTAEATRAVAVAFALWRVSDHGAFSEISHRPGTAPSAWVAAFSRLNGAENLANYKSMDDAFVSIALEGQTKAPFVVLPIETKEGPYVGVSRFRHAPNDTLLVTATRDPKTGKLRVTNFDHSVDE